MSAWLYLSFPLALVAVGILSWLEDCGKARKLEAAALLLEAQNAAKAAPLPDSDTGGKGA